MTTLASLAPSPEQAAPKKHQTSKEIEGERICHLVETGRVAKDAMKAVGVPRSTFWQWVDADKDFRARYESARVSQAHAMAEDALQIANEAVADMAAVQRNRLRVDTIKWFVSKIAPKLYGDRLQHDHQHTLGVVMLPPLTSDTEKTVISNRPGIVAGRLRAIPHPGILALPSGEAVEQDESWQDLG